MCDGNYLSPAPVMNIFELNASCSNAGGQRLRTAGALVGKGTRIDLLRRAVSDGPGPKEFLPGANCWTCCRFINVSISNVRAVVNGGSSHDRGWIRIQNHFSEVMLHMAATVAQ